MAVRSLEMRGRLRPELVHELPIMHRPREKSALLHHQDLGMTDRFRGERMRFFGLQAEQVAREVDDGQPKIGPPYRLGSS